MIDQDRIILKQLIRNLMQVSIYFKFIQKNKFITIFIYAITKFVYTVIICTRIQIELFYD